MSYTERLVQYFVANGISEEGDKRRAILLSSCGPTTYQLLRNLVAPGKPTDKSFTQIVELVRDHHQPRPSTIVQRFNFHTRSQKPGEKISEFVAQLRIQSYQNIAHLEKAYRTCSVIALFVVVKIIVCSVSY